MAQLVNRKKKKKLFALLPQKKPQPLKLFSNSIKVPLENCLNQMSQDIFFSFFILYYSCKQIL